MKFQTKTIRAGITPDPATGAIVPPIYQNTTFAFKELGKDSGYDYSRTNNPTREILGKNLAELEGGVCGFVLATGMAAEATVISLFKHGDHIICGNDVYGGTHRLFTYTKEQFNIDVSFIPMTDPEVVRKSLRKNTKAIWLETPSNPLLHLVDIEAIVQVAREHNLLVIADNTFLSPCFQNPLKFGVDIVVHSTTKYLSGHNDGLGGAVITNSEELGEKIGYIANAMGTVAGAFDSWLVLRGIKTLAIRMREHEKNALAIAAFLSHHPRVKKVYYPGLETHPQYELAKKQQTGFGGMLSFELDGDLSDVKSFFKKLKLFYLAESFGSTESLISHPQTMSHASMPPEAQAEAGITENLIRISVGLEDKDDLIEDLQGALI